MKCCKTSSNLEPHQTAEPRPRSILFFSIAESQCLSTHPPPTLAPFRDRLSTRPDSGMDSTISPTAQICQAYKWLTAVPAPSTWVWLTWPIHAAGTSPKQAIPTSIWDAAKATLTRRGRRPASSAGCTGKHPVFFTTCLFRHLPLLTRENGRVPMEEEAALDECEGIDPSRSPHINDYTIVPCRVKKTYAFREPVYFEGVRLSVIQPFSTVWPVQSTRPRPCPDRAYIDVMNIGIDEAKLSGDVDD